MSPKPIRNVVLFGAGGQLGRHVLKALALAPDFVVTVLARVDSSSSYPPGVPIIRTDMSSASLGSALRDQDAVVSTVTHMALDQQEKVLHAAVKAGVHRFIPSEFGSDTSNERLLRAVPFSGVKRKVTDQLRQLEGMGPEAHFSWTSVVPGPFLEWVLEPGEFGFDIKKRTAVLYDGGNIPFATTKLATIAEAIVGILKHSDATQNRYVHVRSALTTHVEILASLERVTGSQWEVHGDSVARLREQAHRRIAQGDFMGNLDLIRAAILTPGLGFQFESENSILGIRGDENIDSLVADYISRLDPASLVETHARTQHAKSFSERLSVRRDQSELLRLILCMSRRSSPSPHSLAYYQQYRGM